MKRGIVICAVFCACVWTGCSPARETPRSVMWPTMGTIAKLSFRDGGVTNAALCARVQTLYGRHEALLSAWRADSEASRLTTTNGWETRVSEETAPCYRAAFALLQETGGAFNPLMGGHASKLLNLGAIAKGFSADCAIDLLRAAGCTDALVDLGGNLRVVGGIWRTAVRDPFGKRPYAAVIALTNGEATATSGTYERGAHILDGRTRAAVSNEVASVTVVHPNSAMLADGLSTALFVLGPEAGEAFRARFYPTAFVYWILQDDTRRVSPGFAGRIEEERK